MYAFLTIVLVIFVIISCEIKKSETGPDNKVKLISVSYEGCFLNNPEIALKDAPLNIDSLYYVIEDDTLNLSAIKNYNCCGLLKDSMIISGEEVNIYLADTCTELCQCWCMCDFEFRYKFTDFRQKNIHFYVYLKELNESEYVLWKETSFIDAAD